jgi:arginyl-tRNA synthetase
MIQEILKKKIIEAIDSPEADVLLDRPTDLSRGDYSSNIAMVLAKKLAEAKKAKFPEKRGFRQ